MLHAGLTIPPKKKETIPARRASSSGSTSAWIQGRGKTLADYKIMFYFCQGKN
jgi:hypothetical protein